MLKDLRNSKVNDYNNGISKREFSKNKKILIFKKISTLLEGSTSHGIPNLIRTNRLSIRLLWIVCFLTSVSFCSFMVFKAISDFLQYETVSKIERVNELQSKFPTFSFCNINPFMTKESEKLVLDFVPLNRSLNSLDFETKINLSFLANNFALLNSFNPRFGDENRKRLGYNLSAILISCVFNGEICNRNDFEWYYDLWYGNCYRFNSGKNLNGDKNELKETMKSGPKGGLTMQLYNLPSENKYSTVLSEGFRVFIHNNSISPSSSTGINIEPSKITDIAIQRTFFYKEPYPYSNCMNLNDCDSMYYKLLINLKKTYLQQDCFDLCLQKNIIDKCDCYDLSYPMIYNFSNPCLELNELNCSGNEYIKFKSKKINDECLKMCPLECESIKYDLVISSTSTLSRKGYELYKEVLDNFTIQSDQNRLSYDEIKQRFILLNIYYSEMSHTKISESPKSSIIDLLSNLGGTLGLYIGISFLSLIEIVEIILEISFITFNY